MREQISALLDGELEDNQIPSAVASLENDDGLHQDWQLYHLIGDVMRGDGAGLSISERVSQQLVNEPALAMPQDAQHDVKPQRVRTIAANRALYSVAASLAGIAFVGWAAFQSIMPAQPEHAVSAVVAQQARPASNAQPVAYESQVSDYWMAHRQLSGHMTDAQDQQVQFVSVQTSGEERQ